MMKARTTVVSLAVWFTMAAVCLAGSMHMGTWKLNEAKSKLPAGADKNNIVTYSDAGDGKVKVTVEGVSKDGKAFKSVWVGKFDGKSYPVKANPKYDAIMYKVVNDRRNDITATQKGKVVWTGSITVAKDGKSRVVAVSGTDAEGKKFKSKGVYDKADMAGHDKPKKAKKDATKPAA